MGGLNPGRKEDAEERNGGGKCRESRWMGETSYLRHWSGSAASLPTKHSSPPGSEQRRVFRRHAMPRECGCPYEMGPARLRALEAGATRSRGEVPVRQPRAGASISDRTT